MSNLLLLKANLSENEIDSVKEFRYKKMKILMAHFKTQRRREGLRGGAPSLKELFLNSESLHGAGKEVEEEKIAPQICSAIVSDLINKVCKVDPFKFVEIEIKQHKYRPLKRSCFEPETEAFRKKTKLDSIFDSIIPLSYGGVVRQEKIDQPS